MRKSLRSRAAASLVAAAAIGLAIPGAASAADQSARPAISYCDSGTGKVIALETVSVRATPSTTASLVHTSSKGSVSSCLAGYTLGGRYTACGHTNANGWLYVYGTGWEGWSAMTCWADY